MTKQYKIMSRIIELAYDLDGNSLPYDSKNVNVRLRFKIRGSYTVGEGEYQGLPIIEYFSYGGRRVVHYLPKRLEDKINEDCKENDIYI